MTFPEILVNLNGYINNKIDFLTILDTFKGVDIADIQKALDTIRALPTMYTKKQYFTLQKIYNNIQ